MTSEVKLLRRPKLSKLVRIDLTNVKEPEYFSNDSSSQFLSSTDRDVSNIVNPTDQTNTLKLPLINNQNSIREKIAEIDEENLKTSSTNSSITVSSSSSDEITNDKKLVNQKKNSDSKLINKTVQLSQFRPPILYDSKSRQQSSYTQKSLVKLFKPRGPDPLPARPVKYHNEDLLIKKIYYNNFQTEQDNSYSNEEIKFNLNDFLLDSEHVPYFSVMNEKPNVSKYTYNQICRILEERIRRETNQNLNNVNNNYRFKKTIMFFFLDRTLFFQVVCTDFGA
jgi:hypothetical protein